MHFAVYFKGPVHADIWFRICRVHLHANKFTSVTSRNEMADACTRTYYVTSKGTGTALGTRVLQWVSTSKIGTGRGTGTGTDMDIDTSANLTNYYTNEI
jgi:hypothetical protein